MRLVAVVGVTWHNPCVAVGRNLCGDDRGESRLPSHESSKREPSGLPARISPGRSEAARLRERVGLRFWRESEDFSLLGAALVCGRHQRAVNARGPPFSRPRRRRPEGTDRSESATRSSEAVLGTGGTHTRNDAVTTLARGAGKTVRNSSSARCGEGDSEIFTYWREKDEDVCTFVE